MSHRKVSIEALNEILLQDSSKPFQESAGLEWEWDHFLKLHGVITQIEEKERNRNALNSTLDSDKDVLRRLEALPNFISWLNKNGVNTSKLEIQNMGHKLGLGLVAKVDISIGDEVIVIPEKIMMTTMNAKESKLGILAEKDPVIRSMPNVLLSLFLLYETFVSKEASFWKPYIDLLPSTYDTIMYFTLEDMQLLKSSPTGFRETVRMYRNIVRQYAYFHAVFRRATDSASRAFRLIFTFKRYAWAASTAMTRQNSLLSPDQTKDELCLIPLWDMCNHIPNGVFANAYHPDDKYLACYATQNYKIGDEFLIYYGERMSIEHFVHGGFVPNTCVNDKFTLEMGIGSHDKELSRKVTILKQFGLKPQESFVMKSTTLTEMTNLFVFIRLFQADNELLTRLETDPGDKVLLTLPSVEVWKFLMTRFTILLLSAEKSKASLLNSMKKGDTGEVQLTNRQNTIFQLLQIEIQLLQVLAQCAKYEMLRVNLTNSGNPETNNSSLHN